MTEDVAGPAGEPDLRHLARLCAEGDEFGFAGAFEAVVEDEAAYAALLDAAGDDAALRKRLWTTGRDLASRTFVLDPATMGAAAQVTLFALPFRPGADGAAPDPVAALRLLERAGAFGTGARASLAPAAVTAAWLTTRNPASLRTILRLLLTPLATAAGLWGDVPEAEAAEHLEILVEMLGFVRATPTCPDPHGFLQPSALVGLRLLPLHGLCQCCGAPTDLLWGDPDAAHVIEARRRLAEAAASDPDLAQFEIGAPTLLKASVPTLGARAAARAVSVAGTRTTFHAVVHGEDAYVGGVPSAGGSPRTCALPISVVDEDLDAFVVALGDDVRVHDAIDAFRDAMEGTVVAARDGTGRGARPSDRKAADATG